MYKQQERRVRPEISRPGIPTRITHMDPSHLAPQPMDGAKKQRAIKDAKDMYNFVVRSAERAGCPVPPYDFIELIGKGGSGRVYKCRRRSDGELVAIKIINTDDIDYASHALDKDDTIRDFKKEVSILHQLKDNNARNINMIHDAFDFQEQLWIVCDYCTGGSVRTLMRGQPASNPGLEEHFIVPIARELALAMKSVHDIGIIHRDIKCTNVYVNERGEIQLGDFGIVGVVDDGAAKRRTIIGTPHYMPPELHVPTQGNQAQEAYGKEIDIWSFGCSVYEMATGSPPHAYVKASALTQALLQDTPRLEGGNYSPDLSDFVAFCLTKDSRERPTAAEVLKHPYIANTHRRYPTASLVRLVERYKIWEMGGGQRNSLWMPGGAPDVPSEALVEENAGEDDDWNFSTSDDFDEAFDKRYSQMMENQSQDGLRLNTQPGIGLPPIITNNLTPLQQLMQDHSKLSADRGERSLERLWNPESAPYELHTPVVRDVSDDLPLRSAQSAPLRENSVLLDLDELSALGSAPNFNFGFDEMPTVKAKRSRASEYAYEDDEDDYKYNQPEDTNDKRATMDWQFPGTKRATMDWTFPKNESVQSKAPLHQPALGEEGRSSRSSRPALNHTATEPVRGFGTFVHSMRPLPAPSSSPIRDSVGSMIDLSLADPEDIVRPSTATSTAGSTMTDMTSGNPFDLEDDPEQNEIDRSRFSYHKQWQSDGGPMKRNSYRSVPMHTRGSSLSSTDSELDRRSKTEIDGFGYGQRGRVPEPRRQGSPLKNAIEGPDALTNWPNFDSSFGIINSSDENVGRISSRQPSGLTLDSASLRPGTAIKIISELQESNLDQTGQAEIEFPPLMAPHPGALAEVADSQIITSELDRLLDDFANSLLSTTNAFKQHIGWDDEEKFYNGMRSLRSDDSATGDEDELR